MANDPQDPRVLSPEARAKIRNLNISWNMADKLLDHADAMDAEVARLKTIITGIRTAFEKNGYLLLVPGDDFISEISGLLDAIGKDHFRDISHLSEKMKGLNQRIQELEADKARLDWWEENPQLVEYETDADGEKYLRPWSAKIGDAWKYFTTLRDAIDQARVAGDKGQR